MATTPPLRRLESALMTTAPLGAKVMARSSSTGGLSFSVPTHFAPRDAAWLRWASPRVETYTSHFQWLEDLDGLAGGGSEAEEADALAWLSAGDAEAAEADDAGAEQRRDVGVVEPGRKREGEVGTDEGVLGVATVDGVAGEDRVVAEVLFVAAAEEAGAVGAADPGDSDAHAEGPVGGPAFDDFADDLVAEDEGFVDQGEIAFEDVEIGAADSAGQDAEEEMVLGEDGARNIFDLKGLV